MSIIVNFACLLAMAATTDEDPSASRGVMWSDYALTRTASGHIVLHKDHDLVQLTINLVHSVVVNHEHLTLTINFSRHGTTVYNVYEYHCVDAAQLDKYKRLVDQLCAKAYGAESFSDFTNSVVWIITPQASTRIVPQEVCRLTCDKYDVRVGYRVEPFKLSMVPIVCSSTDAAHTLYDALVRALGVVVE